MRVALVAVFVVVASGVVTAQANQSGTLGEPNGVTIRIERTGSMRFVNAEIRDVLAMIAKNAEIEVRYADDLPPQALRREVSINFDKANLADAFKMIVSQADLHYTVVDDRTVMVTSKR